MLYIRGNREWRKKEVKSVRNKNQCGLPEMSNGGFLHTSELLARGQCEQLKDRKKKERGRGAKGSLFFVKVTML